MLKVIFIAMLFGLVGCASPRSNMLMGLNFAEQAPRSLIMMECNGVTGVHEGVAVCEEQTPRQANIKLKILPVPGRVVYSDGLKKKTDDFNYRKSGWIWKKKVIDTTWAPLDLGELNAIYGDVPVAFDVQGLSDVGVINTRGVIYHRVCNDKDIPCSKLIVNFDCSGKIGNTYPGQLGKCARLSGSSQDFEIPLKPNQLVEGAKIRARSGRTGWVFERTVDVKDVELGYIKFQYPTVLTGPDLFIIGVFQREQGVLHRYQTSILIHGYSPEWTGIDQPHWGSGEWCAPFTSDLTEVNEGNLVKTFPKDCINWKPSQSQMCAYAYDRESGDMTYTCVKNGKEERFP